MATRKVKMINLPPSIRRIATAIKANIDLNECDTFHDIQEASKQFPLELFLIAQVDKQGTIERYFIVGLAVPTSKDSFKLPLLYFCSIPDDEYAKIEAFVKSYQKNKSILWSK